MRVLHIAWEYPPLVYGGLGRHVGALAQAQAKRGNDVVVVTQSPEGPADEVVAGVRVVRVPRDPPELPFTEATLLAWVSGLEHALTRAVGLTQQHWRPDVIHAHDWMVTHSAVTAQSLIRCPIVATFHATEAGRHQGWLPNDLSRAIHSVEWWLAQESARTITCSAHMRWEATRLFGLPEDEVSVIPNGIDLAEWTTSADARGRARDRYASGAPLVVFAGRLEWEKGIQTLLDATLLLRRQFRDVRLVVAGRGGREADLHRQAERLRLGSTVQFTGWLPEDELHALIAAADVSVVPSLYEPFGLVALEAAALGTPVIVSDTGGLAEFADQGRVALPYKPGDPDALADALASALNAPEMMAERALVATHELRTTYNWDRVAELTTRAYDSAIASWAVSGAASRLATPPRIPAGNLLSPAVGV